MTLNREIRAKNQASEILKALNLALSEAVELEVSTYLDGDLERRELASASRFYTRINLFEGTVDHEIDLKLIDNLAYSELQQWHIGQVNQRKNSLIKNIASLEQMRRILLQHNRN
ncbi:MAG: hypothetical protein ACFCU7_07470 [Pleurocapsa sp.]